MSQTKDAQHYCPDKKTDNVKKVKFCIISNFRCQYSKQRLTLFALDNILAF